MNEAQRKSRGQTLLTQLLTERSELETDWLPVLKAFGASVLEKNLLRPELTAKIEALHEYQEVDGFDPFGFEPEFLKWVLPVAAWVYQNYFRVQTYDIEKIPKGSVLLVANHSGQMPIDGMMIVSSCLLDAPEPKMVRSMIERWVPTLPFVSWFLARCGQILGTRENFRLLNKQGSAMLVFPEGVRGLNKSFQKAYQLQRFGLGFMRLALENGLPIVPVGVVGAEEQAPAIWNLRGLGKLLGMPAFPITPTFPLLGPLGMLPLPVQYHIYYGDPMVFDGDPDDEDKVIEEKVAQVRAEIEGLLARGLRERTGIFGSW